jgi:hypothetical protein
MASRNPRRLVAPHAGVQTTRSANEWLRPSGGVTFSVSRPRRHRRIVRRYRPSGSVRVEVRVRHGPASHCPRATTSPVLGAEPGGEPVRPVTTNVEPTAAVFGSAEANAGAISPKANAASTIAAPRSHRSPISASLTQLLGAVTGSAWSSISHGAARFRSCAERRGRLESRLQSCPAGDWNAAPRRFSPTAGRTLRRIAQSTSA